MNRISIKILVAACTLLTSGLVAANAPPNSEPEGAPAEPRFVYSQIINPEISLRGDSLLSDLNYKVDQLKKMGITYLPGYSERDLLSVWGLEPILGSAPLDLMMIYGKGLDIKSPEAIANVTAIPLNESEFTDQSYPVWFKRLASAAGLKSELLISKSLLDLENKTATIEMRLKDSDLEVNPVLDGSKVDASTINAVATFIGDHAATGFKARLFIDEYFAYWYFVSEDQEKKIRRTDEDTENLLHTALV